MNSDFWINQLSMEYQWHMLDATGVHWYVGKVINEDGYRSIINGGNNNEEVSPL